MRTQLAQCEEGKLFKHAPPTRPTICAWVSRAWAELISETIEAGFRKVQLSFHETEIDSDVVLTLESLHQADDAVDSDDELQ